MRTFLKRDKWSKGPWDKEPDEEWQDYFGLPTLISRHGITGALEGYVGIAKGHPCFGLNALDIPEEYHVCHGRITHPWRGGEQWKYLPSDSPRADACDWWWVGFHCSHPEMDSFPGESVVDPDTLKDRVRILVEYRSIAFVRKEVRKLAERLSK